MEILTPSLNLPGIEHMICRLKDAPLHKLRQTFIGEQICGSIFEKQIMLSYCLFQVFVAYEEGQLLIKNPAPEGGLPESYVNYSNFIQGGEC